MESHGSWKPKKRWSPLEHTVWREFRAERALYGAHLIVLVSGGKDSVALWYVLWELAPAFRWTLHLAHVHHGGESSYRKQAKEFCAQLTNQAQVPFLEAHSDRELSTESAMREFRYSCAKKWYQDVKKTIAQASKLEAHSADIGTSKLVWLVTAHHADDLLETRLMRLIRGTGGRGLIAMQSLSHPVFRPFLGISRREISAYVEARALSYVEDPSNSNLQYFRNWIRHRWLPSLEKRRPGAVTTLARSLSQISQMQGVRDKEYAKLVRKTQDGAVMIPRSWWLRQSADSQRGLVAYLLQHLAGYNYTKGHVDEILRLWQSGSRRLQEIRVAGVFWGGQEPWLYARKPSQG